MLCAMDWPRQIENQVVHADRRESLNVAGNVFGLRVLDLGCGVGRHALLLAEHGFDVEAI